MDCGRVLIYFSTYEDGRKIKSSGYAGIFIRGNNCDMQWYYRGTENEGEGALTPVYVFRDGTVTLGETVFLEEGMAAATIHTSKSDFMQSGRCLEELEAVYLDGVASGICGGRPDGQELTGEAAYTVTKGMEPLAEEIPLCLEKVNEAEEEASLLKEESAALPETWTFAEFMERLPKMKLPPDGIRRICCRMTMEDMKHLSPEWKGLQENNFLLHGYYEYHHLLLVHLSCRYGERYAIGVPGEFCYRNQYMAENFGFYDFAPLEPGKRRGGSFGYWYYYLEA